MIGDFPALPQSLELFVECHCAAPAPVAMTNLDAWIGLVAWSIDARMCPKVVYAALVASHSINA
jgi:hypothetical protein